jgi:hypothetical protein
MSNYCNYSVQSARFLGTVGGGLASSAHERLLQRLGAFLKLKAWHEHSSGVAGPVYILG